MEQIELIVKIPKDIYESVKDGCWVEDAVHCIMAIHNGIPLPPGHGDLIDRSLLLEDMERAYRFANELVALGFAESFIEHSTPIIEADKEGAEQ